MKTMNKWLMLCGVLVGRNVRTDRPAETSQEIATPVDADDDPPLTATGEEPKPLSLDELNAQARDWLAARGHADAAPLGLGAGWWRVSTAPGEAALAAANRLHDTGEVLAASPDWWREARTR